MYDKTEWKARKGTNLNRFKKFQETAEYVILENAPTSVTEPGTSFSVNAMNKMEQGIFDAHKMIADKADKVGHATAGNFAGLDASGNLSDSGKKAADFVSVDEKGVAGGVATLGAGGIIPANQLPLGVNLPASAIMVLTEDHQEQALAAMYGGTWYRATNPAPRVLEILGKHGSTSSSGVGEFAIEHSGAGTGSAVTVSVCGLGAGEATVQLKSSTRGLLQTAVLGINNIIFNSIVLQNNEILSLATARSDTLSYNVGWTPGVIISMTEYLYFRA